MISSPMNTNVGLHKHLVVGSSKEYLESESDSTFSIYYTKSDMMCTC